ncbi:MAG: glycosyltransferase [bacterium]
MFEIIFLVFLSLYFIQCVIFTIGSNRKFKTLTEDKLPTATILVAARNEENNIVDCLNSLEKLQYPEGKLEIIIINDHSTDRTGELIGGFIKDKPKFKTIIPQKGIGSLKGKANAIANGLEIASGEIILTTDADCTVSPTWAKTIASYYQQDVALVCGYTDQFAPNAFHGMQSIDFIYLLAVAAGAMNLGKPLSAIGNNMSYRKSVYKEVGGYEKLPFSVTEDFALLMAMHGLKKYKIIYPLDSGGMVTSKACPDLKSLFWQKKRWGVGGLDSDLIGFSVMAWGFVAHICMLLTPFFFSMNAIYMILFKFFVDYFFMFFVYQKLKLKLRFLHFLAFEIYFIIYVLVLPIAVGLNRNVKWKGREFKR